MSFGLGNTSRLNYRNLRSSPKRMGERSLSLPPPSKKEQGFYFYSSPLEGFRRCLSKPRKHMQNYVRMWRDFMSFSDSGKIKNDYF